VPRSPAKAVSSVFGRLRDFFHELHP
jgi:hypothetical protein